MEETFTPKISFSFGSAVYAGIIATIVMTVVMALFGTNIITMLGTILLNKQAPIYMIYLAGSIMHFAVGIIYAILYALIIAPLKSLSNVLKAILYSIILAIIAQIAIPYTIKAVEYVKIEYFHIAPMMETAAPPTEKEAAPAETSTPTSMRNKILSKPNLQNWLHHFIYALTLALMYKGKRND